MRKNKLLFTLIMVLICFGVFVEGCGSSSDEDDNKSESSSSYESTLKKYYKAYQENDAKTMINLTMPKDIQEEYCDEYYDSDVEDVVEARKENIEAFWADIESYEWEIKKSEGIEELDELLDEAEDYYSITDLDDFRDYMDDMYGEFDFDADKIEKAYVVEIRETYEYDGEKEKETTISIVYKYENEWYIYY